MYVMNASHGATANLCLPVALFASLQSVDFGFVTPKSFPACCCLPPYAVCSANDREQLNTPSAGCVWLLEPHTGQRVCSYRQR